MQWTVITLVTWVLWNSRGSCSGAASCACWPPSFLFVLPASHLSRFDRCHHPTVLPGLPFVLLSSWEMSRALLFMISASWFCSIFQIHVVHWDFTAVFLSSKRRCSVQWRIPGSIVDESPSAASRAAAGSLPLPAPRPGSVPCWQCSVRQALREAWLLLGIYRGVFFRMKPTPVPELIWLRAQAVTRSFGVSWTLWR